MGKTKNSYTYLKAKMKINLGDLTLEKEAPKKKFSSIEDVQKWANEEIQKLPETFKNLGKIDVFALRVYKNPKFNTSWFRI